MGLNLNKIGQDWTRLNKISVAAAVLHHSPSYNLPCTRIWSKSTENDSYWISAILRVAPPKMAPQRHVRRRSVAAALLHHSPSYDLPCTPSWSKSAENDRVIEWAPFWRWRRRKWRRSATYGALALRQRYYIIPHPTIYLVLEFEATNCSIRPQKI